MKGILIGIYMVVLKWVDKSCFSEAHPPYGCTKLQIFGKNELSLLLCELKS